jgi:glycosyltransferase involved in cell wall biosynthesis
VQTAGASLKILVTVDPELPVPPTHYGGIERIVSLLIEGLSDRGHRVTLVAHRDSTATPNLVPFARGSGQGISNLLAQARVIGTAARRIRPDIIQSFGRLASLWSVLPSAVPKVMSYQRLVTPWAARTARWLSRGSLVFTGCSQSVVSPVAHIGQWSVIYNAVSVGTFPFVRVLPPTAPLAFLGRIEPIKGPHHAIEVARRTGRRLVLAGNVPDEHRTFFDERVRPHIDGTQIAYVGPVDDRAKGHLLSQAAAFLMPITWDEPFGIVMAESLACGTPVIAFNRGAVPEVVEPGVTGIVCDDVDAMVAAVGRIESLDRSACRRAAETRFSGATLVQAYEQLYARLLARPA